jgi:hypothetical protein
MPPGKEQVSSRRAVKAQDVLQHPERAVNRYPFGVHNVGSQKHWTCLTGL